MEMRTLTEQSYLRAGEAFHMARRTLEAGPLRILHDHDYFEVFWIVGGQATHLINGRNDTLMTGDGVLIRPSDRHGFSPLGPEPCGLVNIMFRTETAAHLAQRYAAELAGCYFWTPAPDPQRFRLDLDQQSALERLATHLEAGAPSLARIEGFLLTLLTEVLPPSSLPHKTAPAWLNAALDAARRPEVFRLGAQGLILAAARSHEHVCRSLKTHLGTSPSVLINRIRMDHAARLLTRTDLSITDIAMECGLENMSYFHAIFRQQFQITPRRYRAIHQGDPIQPAADHPAENA
jgi:AraC family cel operon transcriptional repressor